MSLDLFQTDNRDAVNSAERTSAPLLPAGFKESFDTAWDNAVLFGQSFAFVNARNRAMDNIFQQAYDTTRDERFRQDTVQFSNRFRNAAGGHSRKTKLDVYNEIAAEHATEGPEREATGFAPSSVRPITPEQLDVHAADLSKEARDAYKAMAARQGGGFGTFVGSAAGGMADPINVMTFPLAAPEALGIIKTGLTWAGIGAGTQTAIEATGLPYREKVEPGYLDSGEPATNVGEAAVFAGGLGATLKALGTGWRWYKNKGAAPRTIRDAGNVVESEAQIAETNPFRGPEGETAHRDALVKTVDDVVAGRPVDVDRIVTPEMMDGYGSRLVPILKARQAAIDAGERAAFLAREDARLPSTMERLSELQLGEIRGAADALDTGLTARVTGLTEGVAKARVAVEAQTATVEKLRTDAAAAPENAKLADRLTKAEAKLETLTAAAEKRAGELPLRQLTAEARAATRKGRAVTELTKAISKLADDGYGVKLDPAEAASLAERILKAPPDGVEAALRDTTEHLVDKARAARAVAPPVPFGAARPHEEQAAHALRITNVMRTRVQTLAREGGYAMPREEAGAIAARLLSVTEPDARAILDELVLRPRTLAKTMAEPRPTVPEGIPTPPTAPAAGGPDALPPVKEGFVRFYHGGPPDTAAAGQPTTGGGRWTTTDYKYARDYRSEGGRPGDVWYVDIPKGDQIEVKARQWDEVDEQAGTNMVGRYGSIEVPEQWAKQMKPVPKEAVAEAKPAEAPAARVTFEGAPRADYVDKIGSGEHPLPTVADLTSTIKATEDAEKKYYMRHGLTEEEYKRLGTLDRTIDNAGGERADAAIAEKKAIIAKLPEETKTHEFDLPDQATLKQLRGEFEALERSSGETPAEHLDGISRVLKRHINDVMDGDPFARAVFRKALDEARKAGFATKQITNDTMRRLLGDLSPSDQAFMRKEFENFMRPKVEAPAAVRPAPHPDAEQFGFAINPDRPAPPAGGRREISRTEFRPYSPTEEIGKKTVSVGGDMVASADVIKGSDGSLIIQKVETLPAAQRRGYATALVRDLMDEFPDAQITTSMRTDQGSAFFRGAFSSESGNVPLPREAPEVAGARRNLKEVLARQQLQAEERRTGEAPVPSWLQQNRQEAVDFASRLGVTDQIRQMANEGKTAAEISKALGEKMSVDEVRAVRDSLGIAPAGPQAGIGLGVMPAYERAAAEQMLPKNVAKLPTDPEFHATMDRDLQRMRAETPDKEIPIGVDKDGNAITRTVEETATDIEQRRALAEEIRLSCGPQPPEGDSGGQ